MQFSEHLNEGIMKKKDEEKFPGYPHYSQKEDIYQADKEETEIDPENPAGLKPQTDEGDLVPELDFDEEIMGGDLDVPGAELDDEQEELGSEDEENNFYSLGGDDHTE
jgi:hypothetical protein